MNWPGLLLVGLGILIVIMAVKNTYSNVLGIIAPGLISGGSAVGTFGEQPGGATFSCQPPKVEAHDANGNYICVDKTAAQANNPGAVVVFPRELITL